MNPWLKWSIFVAAIVVLVLGWVIYFHNAAVAERREDLVRDLADDYFERSVRLMMGEQPPVCGRPDCVMCATRSPAPRAAPEATDHRWWHRLHR